MNAKPIRPHPPLLTLGDIYYILFRHKWKIMIISALGLIIGLSLPMVWPRVYESEAKLLIKYVTDTRAPVDPNSENASRVTMPDAAGRNIINTELQILTSLDLAQEVATNVGTDKILGKTNGNFAVAGAVVHNNMSVEVPPNSDVVRISFRHKDPAVVQLVLKQVIDTYLDHHVEIHRPGGVYDEFLTKETDSLRSRLNNTEVMLRNLKTNLNIVSVDDSRKVFGDQMTKIQQDIFDADVEMAEHQATIDELSKRVQLDPVTNIVKTADTNSVSPEKLAEYKRINDLLDAVHSQEKALLLEFLPGNSRVKDVREQIGRIEKDKKQLEADNPGLLAVKPSTVNASDTGNSVLQNSLITETTRVAALEKKIGVLTNQLAYIQGRASALDASATSITELERTRKLEEESFRFYTKAMEDKRVEVALGSGKDSNINIIQQPSSPYSDNSKMTKASLGICVGGIVLALGLAFLIELYFDHSFKRPADIEARLGVPLFLSIPYLNGNGKASRLLNAPPKNGLVLRSELLGRSIPLNGSKTTIGRLPENTVPIDDGSISLRHCEIFSRNGNVIVKDLGSTNGTFVNGERIVETPIKADQTLRVGNVEFRVAIQEAVKDVAVAAQASGVTPPWDSRHALRPFYDTLRDRLITYFEVKNLTHNPKLVALTSCGDSAGVTSTAAGLAAALSETGEGNVLLVDMNVERGAAHHFYKGHLSCGIDEALTKDKRHEARVQDNLYVVTESSSNEDTLPRVLPKRFTSLVPKLKASDYDYIIFDMPPMSQISITPRLAKFMDMIMVVVESEKTDRDVVQRAVSMLTETRANVGVVLNKRKNYVPQRIQQEL